MQWHYLKRTELKMIKKGPSKRNNQNQSRQPSLKNKNGDLLKLDKSWRAVTGNHAISELISTRIKAVCKIVVRKGWESSREISEFMSKLKRLPLPIEEFPEAVLDRICSSHQGLVLYAKVAPEFSLKEIAGKKKAIILVLDGLEDPHNLGAILRTSWLTGVSGIIIPNDRAVALTATVHKVACGGGEHVPVLQVQSFVGILEDLKKEGFWVFGLSDKAKVNLFSVTIPDKIVWCIGAEDKGMRITTERICDELVSIPQISLGASYNASVAAGMTLGETIRQHVHHSK